MSTPRPASPAEPAEPPSKPTGSRPPSDEDKTWFSSSHDLADGLIVQEWNETFPAELFGTP